MNLLQPYLSNLLKENDCVIIPGFGAIIAREVPAQYQRQTATFVAPGKELSFNALLKEDDGLLVSQIAKEQKITYAKAKALVSEAVRLANAKLDQEQTYSIREIGSFAVNKNKKIEFNPEFKRYHHLSWYGMQGELKIKELDLNKINQPVILTNESAMKNNVIKWSAAGIAAAILIGLYFAAPFKNDDHVQQAAIGIPANSNEIVHEQSNNDSNHIEETTANFTAEVEAAEVASVENTPEIQPEVAETPVEETVVKNSTPEVVGEDLSSEERYYHVVIGSTISSAEADMVVNTFKNQGILASVLDCGSRYRVVNKTFLNKGEAMVYLRKLKKENPVLGDAWIYVESIN